MVALASYPFRFAENRFNDQHALCGVMKKWVRELPEPLLSFDSFPNIGAKTPEPSDIVNLSNLVSTLPRYHQSTFRYLCGHLHRIVQRSSVNKVRNQDLVCLANRYLSRVDECPRHRHCFCSYASTGTSRYELCRGENLEMPFLVIYYYNVVPFPLNISLKGSPIV